MNVNGIPPIGKIGGLEELRPTDPTPRAEQGFGEILQDAVKDVDGLIRESESAQTAYTRGEEVDLHDVLIKIEEADVAFRALMSVRNKLVDAYKEVMRLAG